MLQSGITLDSLYGANCIYLPSSSPNAGSWLPNEEIARDMRTAGLIGLGEMPVVCAASVSAAENLGLLRDAGFDLPPEMHRYFSTADYLALLRKLGLAGRTMVVHYMHPIDEIPPENYWIAPEVLSFLNNKASLEKLVPVENLPDREVLPRQQLSSLDWRGRLPLVIKAVTNESTGGGIDVFICRTADDIGRAESYFARCQTVIVEKYISIMRNLCLHFALKPDAGIDYLGFAEQVIDEQGRYHGNWIDVESKCPAPAVDAALAVARTGAVYGYSGILGVDAAVLEDGSCKIFDLNFRINGSTLSVLHADAIRRNFGTPVMRRRGFMGRGQYFDLLNVVYRAMARGILLPLGSCNPEAGPYPEECPRLTALVLGMNRLEVMENERELKSMGLD